MLAAVKLIAIVVASRIDNNGASSEHRTVGHSVKATMPFPSPPTFKRTLALSVESYQGEGIRKYINSRLF